MSFFCPYGLHGFRYFSCALKPAQGDEGNINRCSSLSTHITEIWRSQRQGEFLDYWLLWVQGGRPIGNAIDSGLSPHNYFCLLLAVAWSVCISIGPRDPDNFHFHREDPNVGRFPFIRSPVQSANAPANRTLFCSQTQTTAMALPINGKYRTGSKSGTAIANASSHMPTCLLDSYHTDDDWFALFSCIWIPF